MPDYVLSAGRVFLGDRTGGERYVGNSPGLSLTLEVQTVRTMKTLNGVVVPDKVFLLSASSNVSLSLDDVSSENLALYFGTPDAVRIAQAMTGSTSFQVSLGRLYELRPGGFLSARVYLAGREIDLDANFEAHRGFGFVIARHDGPDLYENAEIRIDFTAGRSTMREVGATLETKTGSLRYVENNIRGSNRMFFFPEVVATPDDAIDLKASDWRTLRIALAVTSIPVVSDLGNRDDYFQPKAASPAVDFRDLSTNPSLFIDDYGVSNNG